MKKYIFIALIIFPFFIKAQSPGYLGKNFILSYNIGIASDAFSSYFTHQPIQILTTHSMQAEYVLSRKFGLEAEGSYLNNNFYIPNIYAAKNLRLSVEMIGIGLNCVFYTGGNNTPAPVGNYFKLKTFYKPYKVSDDLIKYDSYQYYKGINTVSETGIAYGVGLEFGHHQIAWNHVLFSLGACVDYTVLDQQNLSLDTSTATQDATSVLFSTYLIYLRMGIGGLLF